MKKPDKKQTIIISTVGGLLVAIAVCVAVWLSVPEKVETVATEAPPSVSEETAETQTQPPETESTATETTTQKETKPPAAPVTKPYKPKPKKPAPKPVTPPSNKTKLNVPLVKQFPSYPTGCEGASATMLLKYYGYNVSLDEVINAIPRENLYKENGKVYGPSIYEKFVGDPRQTYTDERPGYGAFSPVITRSLNNVIAKKGGKHTAVNITGCSFKTLLKQIDNGDPVIVWATAKMQTPKYVNSWYIKQPDGKEVYFEYPRGTHVMVLAGYDGKSVYITDPIYGNVKYSYAAFNDKWELLGRQAIILQDKVETTTAPPTTLPPTTFPPTTFPPTTLPPITIPSTEPPFTTEEDSSSTETTTE